MTKLSLIQCFFVSLLIHLGLGIFLKFASSGEFMVQEPQVLKYQLQPLYGYRVSLQFTKPINPNSLQEEKSNPSQSHKEGASSIQKEVDSFLKNLTYPPSALERGLESQCEWLLMVDENGRGRILEEIQKCKYGIFQKAFQNSLLTHKFQLPPGTILKIPVQFQIQHEHTRNK